MSLPNQVGTFRARAIASELGRAKTRTPQIGVRFAIVEGPETGSEITWYGFLSEKAFNRTVESLRHTGWQGDDLSDLSTVGSQDCEIVVGEEVDPQGVARLKVQWVNALGGGGVAMADVMSADERKAFAAKMRGQVIAASGGKPSPKPRATTAPAQHPNAPGAEDDVGF